jgi:segregation and condensation protein A
MSEQTETEPWDAPQRVDVAASDPSFTVDVNGFEGPLDLLLAMARTQKVDLTKISILQLAIQYLAFVEEARRLRLELAADYLVMAAWLAYLKSRLLLPEPNGDDEPSGEELATQLAFRLKRLDAIRKASTKLMNRSRLGQDIFARGDPEPIAVLRRNIFDASLFDLLSAYTSRRQREAATPVTIQHRKGWSLTDAREVLERLMPGLKDWTPINEHLMHYLAGETERASVLASSFSASLELVREGELELRQDGAFAPLYMRRSKNETFNAMADPEGAS